MSTRGHLGLLLLPRRAFRDELVFGYSRLWLIGCTNSRLNNSLFAWPTVFLINQGDDKACSSGYSGRRSRDGESV